MLLSEAIRMNGMMKPQGFGGGSMHSLGAPCALGGALQSIGSPQIFSEILKHWGWTVKEHERCPACATPGEWIINESLRKPFPDSAINVVWHLNDAHKWTRSQIADWVEFVEPKEAPAVETPELEERHA